jgi:uncharacterized protein YjlB
MPVVVYLLIGHPMLQGWMVMTQKKRDILLLPAGSWGMRLTTSPQYKILLLRSLIMDASWKIVVKYQGKVIRTMWRRIYKR